MLAMQATRVGTTHTVHLSADHQSSGRTLMAVQLTAAIPVARSLSIFREHIEEA